MKIFNRCSPVTRDRGKQGSNGSTGRDGSKRKKFGARETPRLKDQARRITDRPDRKGQTTVPKSETKDHPPAGKKHALDKDE